LASQTSPARRHLRPVLGMAFVSLLICGLLFPLFITGVAQVLMPYQANGEVVQFKGHAAGSELIAQGFNQSYFFHPRNDSASGVDPDITVQDAYSQIPRISEATGLPAASLKLIIDRDTDVLSGVFAEPYVNVLNLNLDLIATNAAAYSSYH